jgi:hypothetical protein
MEEDLYHLLEKVGTPSGAGDLGKGYKLLYNTLLSQLAQVMVQRHTLMCRLQKRMARGT